MTLLKLFFDGEQWFAVWFVDGCDIQIVGITFAEAMLLEGLL